VYPGLAIFSAARAEARNALYLVEEEKLMRNLKASKIGILAFLLTIVIAGCSDPDKNANAGKPGDPLTPPTVTSVTPPDGNVIVCPDTPIVSATFSKVMNPATIKTSTFTLTGPGGANVAGAVTYDVTSNTATFTPTAALAASTKFTATITTGVADTFGNILAANFVWAFTTSTSCAALPPTVTFVTPPDGTVEVCPNTALVSATFSKAMDPTTITTSTFTLTGPGVSSVTGAVTYIAASNIATFTPSASLVLNTQFTATINTGAVDTFGHALQANKVWMFTTAPSAAACATAAPPILLRSACNYGILAGQAVTNTGPTIITGGNLGLSPKSLSSVTGFPPGTVVPPFAIQTPPSSTAPAQGQVDLTAAFNQAAGVQGATVLPGNLSGLTFAPGVYKTSSTVQLTDASPTGAFTLDAKGNADAVFIFQVGSSLTTSPGTKMILAGGAQAKNIFWEVGASATLGTTSVFQGNILAQASVSLKTGATLNGRALARTAAVTLDSNAVNVPLGTCQ
jgi:hypothetical protein